MDQLDDGLRTLAAMLDASEDDFEFDGMSGSMTSAYLPLSDRLMRVTIPSQARSSCAG